MTQHQFSEATPSSKNLVKRLRQQKPKRCHFTSIKEVPTLSSYCYRSPRCHSTSIKKWCTWNHSIEASSTEVQDFILLR